MSVIGRLYHFTGRHHVAGIRQAGITAGGIPLRDTGRILWGFQWLTDDPAWSQGWATMRTLDCDRTEARFTVAIPKGDRGNLIRWTDLGPRLGFTPEQMAWFSEFGGYGADHWWLYRGRIRPSWLRDLTYRPAMEAAS